MRARLLLAAAAALIFVLALLNLAAERLHWQRGELLHPRSELLHQTQLRAEGGTSVHAAPLLQHRLTAAGAPGPADHVWQQSTKATVRPDSPSLAFDDSIISKLRNKYHVVVTADGSVYAQWQVRVCYWHFQKLKKEHPDSDAGGFTRLLHSGKPDGLMSEIPTAVVDPLPKDVPDGGYVVLHRPYGLLQWVQKYAHRLQEDYVLMSEPDHLFLKLPPLWASPVQAAAAPFFYITPKIFKNLIDKYNSRNAPIESMAPIGNSPVMIHKSQLEEICPIWYDLAVKFKRDNQTEKAFGWVQEMYAFSVASSQLAAGPVKYAQQRELMIQPPWDEQLTAANGKDAYILHYTYGQDCDEKTGTPLTDKVGSWHFDKRDYERKYPARNITLPTKCRAKAMVAVVAMINEASAAIEPWEWRPR